jgi:hypothetical protein
MFLVHSIDSTTCLDGLEQQMGANGLFLNLNKIGVGIADGDFDFWT